MLQDGAPRRPDRVRPVGAGLGVTRLRHRLAATDGTRPVSWSPATWGLLVARSVGNGGWVTKVVLWDFDETLAERPGRWWGCMLEIIGRRHPECVADEQA